MFQITTCIRPVAVSDKISLIRKTNHFLIPWLLLKDSHPASYFFTIFWGSWRLSGWSHYTGRRMLFLCVWDLFLAMNRRAFVFSQPSPSIESTCCFCDCKGYLLAYNSKTNCTVIHQAVLFVKLEVPESEWIHPVSLVLSAVYCFTSACCQTFYLSSADLRKTWCLSW